MAAIPAPSHLGLDLPSWRAGQEEAISVMITSPTRIKTLCMPTGFGKSAVGLAAAVLSGKPTAIITSSRGLQDQYMRDGASMGLVDLRGRRNYECQAKPDATCEDGYNSRCPYKGTIACPCSQAEIRAATSRLVVTNYDKWTANRRFGQGLQHIENVIFDEGDEAPEALSRAMQVELHVNEIEDKLQIDFPDGDREDFATWKKWAADARGLAETAMLAARARIQGISDPKISHVRHFSHMRNLTRRLGILATARATDWVVEELRESYQFDPIRPGKYAESALLLRVPDITFMSATIRPKTMFMCGIGKDHFTFREFDSDFDPRRCPIYYVPTMRVDSRNPDLSMLWLRLDQVAARRRDRKGIIQTTSFEYQKTVRMSSRFAGSMILNERGEAPTEKIEEFMGAGPGAVLVSPSVGRGYNFKDDLCRWQFIVKIPFDPPSKVAKARSAEDKEYGPFRAMQKLVQAIGRDVRDKKDWSERIIGDEHCDWFIPRYGHLAPKWFHGFFQQQNTLPPPPDLRSM